MSKKYTDGARAFITSMLVACLLIIAIIIVGIFDLSPLTSQRNISNSFNNGGSIKCKTETPIATLNDDELFFRIKTMNTSSLCITKGVMGRWLVYSGEMP